MSASTSSFERDLRNAVRGEVYFDTMRRGLYSTDASIYRIMPQAVFAPLDSDDVRAALNVAAEHGVTLLPRGAGTSLAGQTVGRSLVIDFSIHINRILEVNPQERWVRVEPGVVRDNLNAHLAPHGLYYAPDPATSSRANVGGMIGNNTAGIRSIRYGMTIHHLLEAEILLADGTCFTAGNLSTGELNEKCLLKNREGELYRTTRKIIEDNQAGIEKRFPKVLRRCSGYPLDRVFLDGQFNLGRLLVGSEGTLAFTLDSRINLEPLPEHVGVCVLHFNDLLEAVRAVHPIVQHQPVAVELLDQTVISMARENLMIRSLTGFLEGDPESVLIVEFHGESDEETHDKMGSMIRDIRGKGMGYAYPCFTDAADRNRVWTMRKNGLGLMLGIKGEKKPTPFIEDAAVPTEHLGDYIEQILDFCNSRGVEVAQYGHASVGLIHVRPILNLKSAEDIEHMKFISEESFRLVKHYGGSLCGEHGDGLVRSAYIERFFGTVLYQALRQIKQVFDPQNRMNPGKIIDPPPIDQDLRYGMEYKVPDFMTEFKMVKDDSFAAAVEMCSGVGTCRQTLHKTMCPSFRATMNEEDSVRGRANALRMAMSGQLGDIGLAGREVYGVMDLCLSCKACKAECPSNVDMAKLKGEFLRFYREQNGTTMRDRLVKATRRAARHNSGMMAPVVNLVQSSGLFKSVLQKFAGIDRRRTLPDYAGETLSHWFNRRGSNQARQRKVVLFADTFTNYHEPWIGKAAVRLLERCNYEVLLYDAGCCQRPRISHGFLKEAGQDGRKTLNGLDVFIRREIPVVVLEPSCASALVDDLCDLIDDRDLAQHIEDNVFMIDRFIEAEIREGHIDPGCLKSDHTRILVHGHCHQKALFGTGSMLDLLKACPGTEVREIPSGCCGMAGSFGYEVEHYALSQKIGEDVLLPSVRSKDDDEVVVACGFSCRHQILDFTGIESRHWVELFKT
jgi:FAD/FMN-containing dehydrogenase/Fe-S oxidoreductase